MLQQNNVLQQVINQAHHDSHLHGTISEQQEQGFILIDETCAKHSSALEGLQSFAGAEIGASQKLHETLQRLSNQMGILQHRTLELEKNTALDWRMQSTEDDLIKVQVKFLGSSEMSESDKVVRQLSQTSSGTE